MSFASLSPTLLARKGGAKPAMRRQSPIIAGSVPGAHPHQPETPDALEDLGWNDLGDPREDAVDRNPAAHDDDAAIDDVGTNETAKDFARLGHHATSTANPAGEPAAKEPAPAQAAQSPAPRDEFENVTPIRTKAPRLPRPQHAEATRTQSKSKRTAFTLRLDHDRHLKLRMACTLSGRSAQSLVTEALDAMLAQIPELDQLVARVQSRPTREG